MVDFTNLQVYGVPVVTYLLVGITTGVLAYATSIGGIEKVAEKAAKSIGDVTGNPAAVLSDTGPEEPKESEEPEEPKESEESVPAEGEGESPKTEGGKKRKKNTPKSKYKSKKNKKNTKRSRK